MEVVAHGQPERLQVFGRGQGSGEGADTDSHSEPGVQPARQIDIVSGCPEVLQRAPEQLLGFVFESGDGGRQSVG